MIGRHYSNPLEIIEYLWPGAKVNHIIFDPELRKGDYDIIRQLGHDGTFTFYYNLLGDVLINIVNMTSCTATPPDDWEDVIGIRYTVGRMKVSTVYGPINMKVGVFPGQKDRIRMPVKCEYIYGNYTTTHGE